MEKALITLTVSEGKRLIAKGVTQLPQVQRALQEGYIIVAGGTTNAYIAEELTGKTLDKARYSAGIICGGRSCITPASSRIEPLVLKDGKEIDEPWQEAVMKFGAGDVFIKGANALDMEGFAGVLVAQPEGGTIGKALPILTARGSHLLLPVGLEKLIPSVVEAAQYLGIEALQDGIGKKTGLITVSYGDVITEADALEILFGVEAIPVAAGGVGGSEGSLTLVMAGFSEDLEEALNMVLSLKGEPPVPGNKQECPCNKPCRMEQ